MVKKHQCGLGRSHIGQWIYPVKRHKLRKTRKMKREKVEQGLKQFDEGKAVDHAQVKDTVKKW